MDREKLGNAGLVALVIVIIVVLSAMRMDVKEKLSSIPSPDGESVLSSSDTRSIKMDSKDLGDLKVENASFGAGLVRISIYDTKKILPNTHEEVKIYAGDVLKEPVFFKSTIYGKEYLNFVIENVGEDEKIKVEFRDKTVKEI